MSFDKYFQNLENGKESIIGRVTWDKGTVTVTFAYHAYEGGMSFYDNHTKNAYEKLRASYEVHPQKEGFTFYSDLFAYTNFSDSQVLELHVLERRVKTLRRINKKVNELMSKVGATKSHAELLSIIAKSTGIKTWYFSDEDSRNNLQPSLSHVVELLTTHTNNYRARKAA